MMAGQLEEGYWKARHPVRQLPLDLAVGRDKRHVADRVRHFLFSTGLRRYSGTWAWIIRHGQMRRMVPVMESVLSAFGRYGAAKHNARPCPRARPSPKHESADHQQAAGASERATDAERWDPLGPIGTDWDRLEPFGTDSAQSLLILAHSCRFLLVLKTISSFI